MPDQKSFTRIENEILHEYRKDVGAAGSVNEVKQYFARAVCALLEKASAGGVRCRHEDVALQPAQTPHYTLAETITEQQAFQAIWRDSDLPAILARMSDPAVHRCVHLGKHPEKTNSSTYLR